MSELGTGFVNNLAERKRNGLQVRQQALIIFKW